MVSKRWFYHALGLVLLLVAAYLIWQQTLAHAVVEEHFSSELAVLKDPLPQWFLPHATTVSANVVVTVTVQPSTVTPDQQATYYVNYSVSDGPAPEATLVFTLPVASFTYDGAPYEYRARWGGFASGRYSYDSTSRQVTWSLGDVPAGTAGQELVLVTFPEGPLDGEAFRTMPVTFEDAGGTHVSAEVPPVVIRTAASLDVYKDPDTACAEQPFDYYILVRNNGTSDLFNVRLTDTLSAGVTFITATLPFSQTGSELSWTRSHLPAGRSWGVNVTVEAGIDVVGASISNTASVTCDQGVSNSSRRDTWVYQPRLYANKDGPTYVRPGDVFTYCLSIEKRPNCPLDPATMTDTLSAGLAFITATMPYTSAGNQVVWSPVVLWQVYRLTVQADSGLLPGATVTNEVEAAAWGAIPDVISTTAIVTTTPHLEASKGVDVYGSHSYFYIDLTNPGTASITNLDVVDRVPANTLFSWTSWNSLSCNPLTGLTTRVHNSPSLVPPPLDDAGWLTYTGGSGPYGPDTRWVHWHIPSLSNQSVELRLSVSHIGLLEGTRVQNTAWYTSSQLADTVSAAYYVPPQPTFDLFTSAYPSLVSPDHEVEFTIHYRNRSSITTTHVILTSTLPAIASFVSADHGGVYLLATHQVVWNVGTLAHNKGGYIRVRVLVPRGVLDRSGVCHQVVLSSAEWPAVGPATACSTVRATISFQVEKTTAAPTYLPGSVVTYTLTYENVGDGAVRQINVWDRLPDEMVLVTATTPGGETLYFSNSPASIDDPPLVADPSWRSEPLVDTTWLRWARAARVEIDTPYSMTVVLWNDPTLPLDTRITNTVIILGENLPLARTARVVTLGDLIHRLYLPLIATSAHLPDLIVHRLTVEPSAPCVGQPAVITLVVENIGLVEANGPLWVDLYIDPDPDLMPPQVNQTWDMVGSQYGIAWLMDEATTIAPGQQITLTSLLYTADWSDWPGYFTGFGTHILYAQVDSYNGTSPFAAVQEMSENNNVIGPVSVPVSCPTGAGVACPSLEAWKHMREPWPIPRPTLPWRRE
jgi:uncharacterized repeat protein (TIGR01451 family)